MAWESDIENAADFLINEFSDRGIEISFNEAYDMVDVILGIMEDSCGI